jgi:hypothetical protein
LITHYLSHVEAENINLVFIRRLEKHIRDIMLKSEKVFLKETRKNMYLKGK